MNTTISPVAAPVAASTTPSAPTGGMAVGQMTPAQKLTAILAERKEAQKTAQRLADFEAQRARDVADATARSRARAARRQERQKEIDTLVNNRLRLQAEIVQNQELLGAAMNEADPDVEMKDLINEIRVGVRAKEREIARIEMRLQMQFDFNIVAVEEDARKNALQVPNFVWKWIDNLRTARPDAVQMQYVCTVSGASIRLENAWTPRVAPKTATYREIMQVVISDAEANKIASQKGVSKGEPDSELFPLAQTLWRFYEAGGFTDRMGEPEGSSESAAPDAKEEDLLERWGIRHHRFSLGDGTDAVAPAVEFIVRSNVDLNLSVMTFGQVLSLAEHCTVRRMSVHEAATAKRNLLKVIGRWLKANRYPLQDRDFYEKFGSTGARYMEFGSANQEGADKQLLEPMEYAMRWSMQERAMIFVVGRRPALQTFVLCDAAGNVCKVEVGSGEDLKALTGFDTVEAVFKNMHALLNGLVLCDLNALKNRQDRQRKLVDALAKKQGDTRGTEYGANNTVVPPKKKAEVKKDKKKQGHGK